MIMVMMMMVQCLRRFMIITSHPIYMNWAYALLNRLQLLWSDTPSGGVRHITAIVCAIQLRRHTRREGDSFINPVLWVAEILPLVWLNACACVSRVCLPVRSFVYHILFSWPFVNLSLVIFRPRKCINLTPPPPPPPRRRSVEEMDIAQFCVNPFFYPNSSLVYQRRDRADHNYVCL